MTQDDPHAYLPQDRRGAIARNAPLPERSSGAVSFTDVTGFTPLADSLARALGPRRGAEELAALLNRVYSRLIARIEAFGGSVVSFSGDAMTCWFDDLGAGGSGVGAGPQPPAPPSAARRAVACALAMRESMAAFAAVPTPDGPAALSVKTAVAAGAARRFVVGDPAIQLIDTLAGPTLDRLAASARLAGPADVIVDAQTLAALGGAASVAAWREDRRGRAAAVEALAAPVAPVAPPGPVHLDDASLRPWLLPAVFARLRHSGAPLLAELRPAVALMLQFSGIDYEAADAGERLDRYIRQVQRVVARYEGALIDVTMADKGGYLYLAFGAPVAHEDDPARALRAALELRDLAGAARVGVSQGLMRAGPYGGDTRCAYGVLGDEVNLACRLMSAAAPGQILVSDTLQRALGAGFAWRALPELRVRGRRQAVAVAQLTGATPAGRTHARPAPLAGRADERAALAAALRELRAGAGGVAVIAGEPGIGKSRLVDELAGQLGPGELLRGAGLSVEQDAPYRAWRDIFMAYFELDGMRDPAARRAAVTARVSAAAPALAGQLPLLNDLLGLEIPDTPLSAALSGAARSERLDELLVDLLAARAARGPLAVVIEDGHWLDSRSWALVERVARAGAPLLLLITTRDVAADHADLPHLRAILAGPGVRWLRLGRLGERDTQALAAARLGLAAEQLPARLAGWLHRRADGNPLFVEELIAALRERDMIWFESDGARPLDPPRCRVADDLDRLDHALPATLQGLLLARLDRLPPAQQLTLKVAAVVGPTFAFEPLLFARARQSALDGPALRAQLRTLAALDYTALEEPEPRLAYSFRHVLAHEAAYETLLYAQRRALHRSVAEWYERRYGDGPGLGPHLPLLAHHYRRAELRERERHYSWLAGLQAAEQYANAEAIGFFSRALELTPADDLAGRFEVLFEREAAEELLALRDDQARDLAALEALAEALGDDRRRAEVARNRARLAERLGDFAAMRALAARAVALAEAAGATGLAIRCYDQWAWACMRAGQHAEGRALADSGLRLARASDDRHNEAQMLTAIGCAYAESEQYAEARDYLEQSRAIFRAIGRQRGEGVALGNLGETAARQGDLAAARAFLSEALQIYRATGDRRNEGWALGNLGMAAAQLGDAAAAGEYHAQALAIARRAGDRNTESLALVDLGLIAHQRGDQAVALERADAALAIAAAAFARTRALLLHGHALAALGRAAEAEASYAAADELARAANLGSRAAEAAAGRARLALARGDPAAALAIVAPLLDLIARPEAVSGADEPMRVFLTCARALAAAGDPRAAGVLAAARALIRARADTIPDAAERRRFLEYAPYHRAILQ